MNQTSLQIILASPRGFCAGVERAVSIVEKALEIYGAPVYVRHEIVHNQRVLRDLRAKGAVFVAKLDDVPEGAITVFSAHGVSQKVVDRAEERQLPTIDATCPLVTKVHSKGKNYAKKGYEIILIGHEGHPEVEGTMGRIEGVVHLVSTSQDVQSLTIQNDNKLAYITQTTLSVDDTKDIIHALKQRFPNIQGGDVSDICYATQNRQDAVRALAKQVDMIFVMGAKNSSNSNRLQEIGIELGVKSYLIESYHEIEMAWFQSVESIGITAGASAPESVVQELIEFLSQKYDVTVKTLETIKEDIYFNLPRQLRQVS